MTDSPKAWTEEEWRQRLSPMQYHVLREAGTERPGSGELLAEERGGTYTCGGCGAELFSADTKFDAGCGWPSFFEARPGAVEYFSDFKLGYERKEVRCANCGSHLGHIFPDAPQTPTGMRYCMNSAALGFVPSES
ncbi:peptide-methionine (R)-S-oxide reductase MsrB [Scrofimicrobium sp. R131]|uniref:peptide-methionine (R)-S-oxide reductase n=1 Tax=Scrofimicrobium appendicitidis TaxID=3079930 RepID=A0AAU7V820_9ACTO